MKSITPIDCIEHFWVEILERKISISEKDSSLIYEIKKHVFGYKINHFTIIGVL